jgi:outer membrane protein assembly factor BamB
VWTYTGIDRGISTVSIAEGLVYAADVAGRIHCLETDTGRAVWVFETNQETWGSTLVADGRVYLPTRSTLWILAAGREKKLLGRQPTGGAWSPVAANGMLYLATHSHLLALGPER